MQGRLTNASMPKILLRVCSLCKSTSFLAIGMEFLDLEMVKIKADHLISGGNSLTARLNERGLSNWDVPSISQAMYKRDQGSRLYLGASMD